MHRSTSASRVSEAFAVTSSSSTSQSPPQSSTSKPTTHGSDEHHHQHLLQLPTYDPLSHVAKRERRRIRSAENAIHIIPLLLVVCAAILWFFSRPGLIALITRNVDSKARELWRIPASECWKAGGVLMLLDEGYRGD